MSEIISANVEYESRGPVSAIDYTIVVHLDNPEIIGKVIRYIIESAQVHLLINNIVKYRLSMLINTAYIFNFGVPFPEIHNYQKIENRLIVHAQSAKSLLGEDKIIEFIVKAVTWDS